MGESKGSGLLATPAEFSAELPLHPPAMNNPTPATFLPSHAYLQPLRLSYTLPAAPLTPRRSTLSNRSSKNIHIHRTMLLTTLTTLSPNVTELSNPLLSRLPRYLPRKKTPVPSSAGLASFDPSLCAACDPCKN